MSKPAVTPPRRRWRGLDNFGIIALSAGLAAAAAAAATTGASGAATTLEVASPADARAFADAKLAPTLSRLARRTGWHGSTSELARHLTVAQGSDSASVTLVVRGFSTAKNIRVVDAWQKAFLAASDIPSPRTRLRGWRQIVFTRRGSLVSIYVDGQAVAEGQLAQTYVNGPFDLGVRSDDAWPYRGALDSVAVFEPALPSAAIGTHFAIGASGEGLESAVRADRPIAYWTFDRLTGASVRDASGHGPVLRFRRPPTGTAGVPGTPGTSARFSGATTDTAQADLPVARSFTVELWAKNNRPVTSTEVTGYLFSWGKTAAQTAAQSDSLAIGGSAATPGGVLAFNGAALLATPGPVFGGKRSAFAQTISPGHAITSRTRRLLTLGALAVSVAGACLLLRATVRQMRGGASSSSVSSSLSGLPTMRR